MAKLPNPFDTDVTKLMAEFKLPGVDMETVLATQRKNIEALTKANQLAIEGLQTVARRQAEILRAGFEEASALAREMFQKQSPEDLVTKQTDAAKHALEKAFGNAREATRSDSLNACGVSTKDSTGAIALVPSATRDAVSILAFAITADLLHLSGQMEC